MHKSILCIQHKIEELMKKVLHHVITETQRWSFTRGADTSTAETVYVCSNTIFLEVFKISILLLIINYKISVSISMSQYKISM